MVYSLLPEEIAKFIDSPSPTGISVGAVPNGHGAYKRAAIQRTVFGNPDMLFHPGGSAPPGFAAGISGSG